MNYRTGKEGIPVPLTYSSDGILHTVHFELGQYTIVAENVDAQRSVILSAMMCLDNILIQFPCDRDLWLDVLKFLHKAGVHRNFVFECEQVNSVRTDSKVLFYSGGADSEYCRSILSDVPTFQRVSGDLQQLPGSSLTFRSNIMDFVFERNWEVMGPFSSIEFVFPLISPYRENLFGIEKEIWDDTYFHFSFPEYKELLFRHGIHFSSPIADKYSWEYIRDIPEYLHCNKGLKDFCYSIECDKCASAFLFDTPGFDKSKYPVQVSKARFISTEINEKRRPHVRELLKKYQSTQ